MNVVEANSYSFEKYGNIYYLLEKYCGPVEVLIGGCVYHRYFNRIYLPTEPSKINAEIIDSIAILRSDLRVEIIDNKYTQECLSILFRMVKNKKGKLKRLLDFGCGDGNLSAFILSLNKNDRPEEVIGVDISRTVAEIAHSKYERYRLGIAIRIDKYEKLTLRSSYFDGAIANFVLHFQISKLQAKEIHRILKSGCKFVYNDYRFCEDREHSHQTIAILKEAGFKIRQDTRAIDRFWDGKIETKEQLFVECIKE